MRSEGKRDMAMKSAPEWLCDHFKATPHMEDCHPVPVGAVIPKGTPFWLVYESGFAAWDPRGYDSDHVVGEHENENERVHVWLTLEPIEVAESNCGVWDETDKRDRFDADCDGAVWRWVEDHGVWECRYDGTVESFGSLAALRKQYGDQFIVGFAE